MFRYQFQTPRFAFGVAAMAMTAVTIGALVVLPSRMESDGQTSAMAASSHLADVRATVLRQLHALRSYALGTQRNPHSPEHS